MELATQLKASGYTAIHVSTGGLSTAQRIPVRLGYQVEFAQVIRQTTAMLTFAVGLITEAAQAKCIGASGQADAVAIGRAGFYHPHWPWHAAATLGAHVQAPPQYWKSQPREFRDLFHTTGLGYR